MYFIFQLVYAVGTIIQYLKLTNVLDYFIFRILALTPLSQLNVTVT